MARKSRKKKGSVEQLVIGGIGMGGLLLAVRKGGGATAIFQNWMFFSMFIGATVFVVFLILKFLLRTDNARPSSLASAPSLKTPPASVPSYPDRIDPLRIESTNANTIIDTSVRPTEWTLPLIRELEWKRFEELCEGFWKAKGYLANLTGPGADGGVDVVIQDRADPSKIFAIIQCKHWSSKQVGVETVRALWGAKDHFKAKLAIFYGMSGFTDDAVRFAAEKHLKLVNGEELLTQIKTLESNQQAYLLEQVTRGDYTTPTCPNCDIKMVRREGKGGKVDFWGCRNFRRCGARPITIRA
ncbi:MAG: restriction endonuclease [Stenotrophobium sp.]